jgi:hypothetical protein
MTDTAADLGIGIYGPAPLSYSQPGPFVYYIQSGQFVKIGYSINPEKRVDQIRRGGRAARPSIWAGNPVLIGYEIGGADLEKQRHAQFAHLHDQGEWFNLTTELAEHAEEIRQAQAILEYRLSQEDLDRRAAAGYFGKVTLDMAEQLELALDRTTAPDMNWRAEPPKAPKPQRNPRNQRERIAALQRGLAA